MKRLLQSIRFRLSLGIALAVFTIGTLLIVGVYLWQVNQLDRPVLSGRPVLIEDVTSGRVFETNVEVVFPEDIQRVALDNLEQEAYRTAIEQLRRASFGGMVLLFFASFASGWWLSGWAFKPVDRISAVAKDITANDLSRRIALQGPGDELKGLADTFDGMLDRLEDSFNEQRRFVHEASHELRNPLAVARTNLEVALASDDPAELRRSAEIAHRSTERMSALVEDLLEQARRGIPELSRASVDVGQLVDDRAEDFRAAATERGVRLVSRREGGNHLVMGDQAALSRALGNLLANAVRLAPPGTTVEAVAAGATDAVSMVVRDEGPGIAVEDADLVFERFWRGSDPGAGSGLGLSLVRRIAERHGGTATVEVDGSGSRFILRVPRVIGASAS